MFKPESFLNKKEAPKKEIKPPFEINERKEAVDFIQQKYLEGERPVVTVPRKYLQYLKQGLKPYATWIGIPLIAATFGREAYTPEDRVVVNVKGIPIEQIQPRFTGPNNAFSGVVILNPPIPPEYIEYSA